MRRYPLFLVSMLFVLTSLLLIAAALLQEIPAAVLTIIGYFVAILMGGFGVPVMDWLKNLLNLSGLAALRFVLLVSVLVSGIALYLGGALVGFTFDPEHIIAFAGLFLATATYVYKALNPIPQT